MRGDLYVQTVDVFSFTIVMNVPVGGTIDIPVDWT